MCPCFFFCFVCLFVCDSHFSFASLGAVFDQLSPLYKQEQNFETNNNNNKKGLYLYIHVSEQL